MANQELGLSITVCGLGIGDSCAESELTDAAYERELDYFVRFDSMPGDDLMRIRIRQGTDPKVTVRCLSRVIELLEEKGSFLLDLPERYEDGGYRGDDGQVVWHADQEPDEDELNMDVVEFGRLWLDHEWDISEDA
jgi:hypothetical protein